MNRSRALIAVCFCAGLLGALANSLALWFAGSRGWTALAGVSLAPTLSLPWLCPRLVWGGLWGLCYFFTVGGSRSRHSWIRKGLWISLLPSAVQLFYVFPYQTPHGQFGLGLGTFTPLVVLSANLLWGLVTGIFSRLLWGRG